MTVTKTAPAQARSAAFGWIGYVFGSFGIPAALPPDQLLFAGYDPGSFYDESIAPNGNPRSCAARMYEQLAMARGLGSHSI